MSLRWQIIIGLIILAVSLHFMSKTLRGALTLLRPEQAAASVQHRAPSSSLFTQWSKQAKRLFARRKKITAHPALPTFYGMPQVTQTGPAVLQVIPEEPPPPLTNPALSPQTRAQLQAQLARQRASNTALTQEVGALFGTAAQRQVIVTLTAAEKESWQNAQTCADDTQYQTRQQQIDARTQTTLTRIFEQHKSSFNYKAHSGNAEWNAFYRRLNSFRRAQD